VLVSPQEIHDLLGCDLFLERLFERLSGEHSDDQIGEPVVFPHE
jgi:hypothetical protein